MGHALCLVDAGGRLTLPAFALDTLNRRRADWLTVGCHEADPCLIAYDPDFASLILADVERRRLAEEDVAPSLHFARARRAFGFVDRPRIESGAVMLSPLMRRRASIGATALLIGTGGAFEIWDAASALSRGDPDLRDLARFHLERQQAA